MGCILPRFSPSANCQLKVGLICECWRGRRWIIWRNTRRRMTRRTLRYSTQSLHFETLLELAHRHPPSPPTSTTGNNGLNISHRIQLRNSNTLPRLNPPNPPSTTPDTSSPIPSSLEKRQPNAGKHRSQN